MQKHEIEVRTVGQLKTAQLAVGNDPESCGTHITVHFAARLTVARTHVRPCNRQRPVQHDLRQPAECIAGLHQRQVAAGVGERDAEHTDALESRQCLGQRFGVVRRDTGEILIRIRVETFPRWR